MPAQRLAARVVGTTLLCGLGVWYAVSEQAQFRLGGNNFPSRKNRIIRVNATGADAVAIGGFFIALGVINLALGITSRRRIALFWTGASLFVATLLYGAARALIAVMSLFSSA